MNSRQIKKLLKEAGYSATEPLMEDFSGEVKLARTWAAEATSANKIDDFFRRLVRVEWDESEGKWVTA